MKKQTNNFKDSAGYPSADFLGAALHRSTPDICLTGETNRHFGLTHPGLVSHRHVEALLIGEVLVV